MNFSNLKQYTLDSPKTTGDTIWIDYSAPGNQPIKWYVNDPQVALDYWSKFDQLTEAEKVSLTNMYPTVEQHAPAEAVSEEEIFDATLRFTAFRVIRAALPKEKARMKKKKLGGQLPLF